MPGLGYKAIVERVLLKTNKCCHELGCAGDETATVRVFFI